MTENFFRRYVKGHPQNWGQYFPLAEFVVNSDVNVVTSYNPFYLNLGDQPLVPSILMYGGGVLSHVEVVQIIVDHMKIAQQEAQASLSIAQDRDKAYVDRSKHEETYKVGDEVVLSTCNIHVSHHLPTKLWRHGIGP